ncbi:MAG: desulfoferrodoxin family protein [Planctomycetota bacterium]
MEKVTRRIFLGVAGASVVVAAAGRQVRADEIEGQTAKDPGNMTVMEKKHVPKITVNPGEPVEVDVVVGEVVHPMEEGHYITWIDVYLDGKKLSRTTLSPVVMAPCVTVKLAPKTSGMLTVVEECNLHGIWKNCVEIKAE